MSWIRGTCLVIALAGAHAVDCLDEACDDVSSLIQVGGLAELPPAYGDMMRSAGKRASESLRHKFQSAEAGNTERLEWAAAANAKGAKPVAEVASEPVARVLKTTAGHRAQQVAEASDEDEDEEQASVESDDGYLAGGEWRALSQHDSRKAQKEFLDEAGKAEAASRTWSEMDNEADSEKVAERRAWAEKLNEEGAKARAAKKHFQNMRTCHGFRCDPQPKGGTALFPNASLIMCAGMACQPSDCCFTMPMLPEYLQYDGHFMGRGNIVNPKGLAISSPQGQMDAEVQLVTIDIAKYECYVSKECVGFTHQGLPPPLGQPVWVHFKNSPYMGKTPLPAGCSSEEVGTARMLAQETGESEAAACKEKVAASTWTSYILPMPNLPKRLAK